MIEMSFLMRGRSSWWLRDQTHPRAAERAPETVSNVTVLPVAAPAPEGGTDDLRAEGLAALRAIALRQADRLRVESVGRQTFIDGTDDDKQWVAGELLRLDDLATLTEEHGPWVAAQHMYGGAR